MATRILYFVRHGEYDWDRNPGPSTGLTPRGVQQARLTAARLRRVPATAVYSSDLTRAVETAAHITRALRSTTCLQRRLLRECWLPWPGVKGPPRAILEAARQQPDRIFQAFIRPARGGDKHEIIVSHGNVIRYVVSRVLTGSAKPCWLRMRTLNCAITIIEVAGNGRATLVSYNDVGHLPPHLVTTGVPTNRAPRPRNSA